VTIPVDIREQAGLLPHTEVRFKYNGAVVRIVPVAASGGMSRRDRIVAHL
jgi:bifunctional DNA-binding transcriptional regulator/antitoxin component of YhaV-PrlF toxin-antitoxin module